MQVFGLLPASIRDDLLRERDPHGNVQVRAHVNPGFSISCCYWYLSHNIGNTGCSNVQVGWAWWWGLSKWTLFALH